MGREGIYEVSLERTLVGFRNGRTATSFALSLVRETSGGLPGSCGMCFLQRYEETVLKSYQRKLK
jgi:hypothetical protein